MEPDDMPDRVDVDELIAANQASNRTMLSLIESVRQETVARDRKITAMEKQQSQLRWAIGLVCLGISILVAVGVINAVNINTSRRQQGQLAEVGAEVDRTNRTLLDCMNATNECGKINARRQMLLLDEVKRYELTGFYCIRQNPAEADPDADAFLKCMQRLYPGGPELAKR
jgi:hypothetical protein